MSDHRSRAKTPAPVESPLNRRGMWLLAELAPGQRTRTHDRTSVEVKPCRSWPACQRPAGVSRCRIESSAEFRDLVQGSGRRLDCGDRLSPVGAEDITHQTWTGTTRRAMKTGVFNGRREFGE